MMHTALFTFFDCLIIEKNSNVLKVRLYLLCLDRSIRENSNVMVDERD